jgi:hypothetical protein
MLIPKKKEPSFVKDFRPISLTHSFAKLISKVLANRLRHQLDNLISVNQATFIKQRCIHDSFIYVREVLKDLHKRKISTILIKLDISMTFNTMNWSYLLHILEHLGFG